MLRALILLSAILVAERANADTYFVDASIGGTDTILNSCVGGTCVRGYETPLYTFSPGSTINFGTLTLSNIIQVNTSVFPSVTTSALGVLVVEYGPITVSDQPVLQWSSFCTGDCPLPPSTTTTADLVFTLPQDADQIQLEWTAPYEYVAAAVPEPSTWATLIVGFACIALIRRSRRSPANYE